MISFCITLIIFFIFSRNISWQDIKEGFSSLSWDFVLIFIIFSLIGTLLRTIRYQILISHKLIFIDMFLITLVRNFSVDLLPARTASLLFYSYLTHKKGIKLEEGGSSFIIAMFYDVLALSIMLFLAFVLISRQLENLVLLIIIILFVLSILFISFCHKIFGWIIRIKFLRKYKKIKEVINNLHQYFNSHHSLKEKGKLLVLSFCIKVVKYLSIFFLFTGMTGIKFQLKSLSLFSFGIAGTEISSLFPIQGLAGFGTWEAVFKLVFENLQNNIPNLFIIGLVIHTVTQVWEYLIGIPAFLYLQIKGKNGS